MQINKELFNALLEFTNDRWITVHPNGEDEKGRHLLIKDGETLDDAMSRQWGKDDGQLQLNFPGAKKAVKDAKMHENKKQVSRDKLYKALIDDKDDDASNKRIMEAEKEYEKYHEPIKYYDDFMEKYEEEKAEASRKKIRDEKYKQEAEKNKQIAEKKAKEEEAKKKQEPKKEVPKAEGSPFGEGVETRKIEGKGFFGGEETEYSKGAKTARVEKYKNYEGTKDIYRMETRMGGSLKDIKTYTTEKGMQKAVRAYLSDEANKETKALETKLSIEDTEKAYKDALQAKKENDHALRTHKFMSDEWLKVANKHHIAKIDKAVTDSRRQYAEAIMANFEKSADTSYEDKLKARKERYEELSDKAQAESNQALQRFRDKASVIPGGQPIHGDKDRRYREKTWDILGKSVKLGEKADYYAGKASSVGKGGISADDANAIAKLTAKYKSGVNSAEKRRIIDRVISIHKNAQVAKTVNPNEDYSSLGFNVERNSDLNRLQLKFGDIPDPDVRKVLKSNGFRWSPSNKAWQRQSGSNAEASLKRVAETLRMKNQAMGSMI